MTEYIKYLSLMWPLFLIGHLYESDIWQGFVLHNLFNMQNTSLRSKMQN